jgi:hypothetical protein
VTVNRQAHFRIVDQVRLVTVTREAIVPLVEDVALE